MHTKILMISSAIIMAIVGLAASFLPQEILAYADAWDETFEVTLVQILGALYLGFAILNWTARGNLIGGVYSRPVAIANFMHMAIVAMLLGKIAAANHHLTEVIIAAVVVIIFAAWFGVVLFSHPKKSVQT